MNLQHSDHISIILSNSLSASSVKLSCEHKYKEVMGCSDFILLIYSEISIIFSGYRDISAIIKDFSVINPIPVI